MSGPNVDMTRQQQAATILRTRPPPRKNRGTRRNTQNFRRISSPTAPKAADTPRYEILQTRKFRDVSNRARSELRSGRPRPLGDINAVTDPRSPRRSVSTPSAPLASPLPPSPLLLDRATMESMQRENLWLPGHGDDTAFLVLPPNVHPPQGPSTTDPHSSGLEGR